MLNRIFLTALLLLSLFAEGTVLPFPFVFILGSVILFFYPDAISFIMVFLACLLLDIVVPHHLAVTLLFVFGFQLLLYVLQKPFSLIHPLPKLVILFFATIVYQKTVGYPLLLVLDSVIFFMLGIWVKMADSGRARIKL